MDAALHGTTLSFFDHLLSLGRRFQSQGQHTQATQMLRCLLSNRHLPMKAAKETRGRLAEMMIEDGEYRKARRHLTALLTQEPRNPRYHFQMAQAIALDEDVDHRRALRHFQRAVKLDPRNADYWCEFGLLALELGKKHAGLRALHRALKLSPDDSAILEKAVDGFIFENRYEEARSILRAARFRHPRDSRFTKLWNDLHFQELLAEQEVARRRYELNENRPMLLPFDPARAKPYRRDGAAHRASPHLGLGTLQDKHQIR